MTKMAAWNPIGGCDETPGVWDDGNGACIYVARRRDGVIRRVRRSYCGRGGNWTVYTAGEAVGDVGGPWVPDGLRMYPTASQAARALLLVQVCPRCHADILPRRNPDPPEED